jgi:hypothetical protein
MGNLMESVFKSIDDVNDLLFVRYSQEPDGQHYFYLLEQSSLQVLRELPLDTSIQVSEIFSQRQRIAQKITIIKEAKTIKELLEIVLPLVENGNFPCDNFTLTLNKETKLQSHDDNEVHLISIHKPILEDILCKVFERQGYNCDLLFEIINQPNLYHRIDRPNKLVDNYKTFEEVVDAL